MEKRKCKYCEQEFECVGRVFSNHVRWCDKNPKSKDTEALSKANKKHVDSKLGIIKEFNVKCNKCEKIFVVLEREYKHPLKEKYFCSIKCANSKKHTEETKNKIRNTLAGRELIPRETRVCFECNSTYIVPINSVHKKKFCSRKCHNKNRKSKDEYLVYRAACKFNFNVWQYPNEFELDLIRKHGWYKAANHGNNIGGVSRDHRISVKYGWENNIPAEVMSHPANCKLMVHCENSKKHMKCSVLHEVLLEDIKRWNEIYGF